MRSGRVWEPREKEGLPLEAATKQRRVKTEKKTFCVLQI
jgi:hypothetical protein